VKIERHNTTNGCIFLVEGHSFATRSQARQYIRSLKPRQLRSPATQGDWCIPHANVAGVPLNVALEYMQPGQRVRRGT